jgi:hypothetical protein
MRVPSSVKKNQVAGLRPDDRAVPFHRADVGRGWIVREDELAARTCRVIGAEEQPCQGVGVDVTLEPHRGPALDVQHDAIPVIERGHDGLSGCFPGQFEEITAIGLVQPGQVLPDVGGVQSAAGDGTDVW